MDCNSKKLTNVFQSCCCVIQKVTENLLLKACLSFKDSPEIILYGSLYGHFTHEEWFVSTILE